MEKIMFFVEGSYFYKSCKHYGLTGLQHGNCDIFKFCESFIRTATQTLIRVYYYDAPLKQQWDEMRYKRQQQFFSKLTSQGYVELRKGRLQGTPPNIKEKGVDVLLAVDLIKFAYTKNYDIACILSADGDYVPAIKMCKELGGRIWNIYSEHRGSYHLKNECDISISFNGDLVKKHQIP